MSHRLIRSLASVLVVAALSGPARGSDSEWVELGADSPVGLPLTLNDPPFHQFSLPAGEVEGRWLRASALTNARRGETRITVVASMAGRRISFSMPTECRVAPSGRHCEAVAWIPPETDQVKLTIWSERVPATVTQVRVETGLGRGSTFANATRLDELLRAMSDLYYLSAEVDWSEVRRIVEPALAAPSGVDPIPGAIRSVMTLLPGNKHTLLLSNTGRGKTRATVRMPNCRAVTGKVHLLSLPGSQLLTPNLRARYVDIAHRCLLAQQPQTQWIIDLRDNDGGNSDLSIAALAPLFPAGELIQWENGRGERLGVELSHAGVSTGGFLNYKNPLPVDKRSESPVLAWIGPGCASACEVLAAALSGRRWTRLVGEHTAGLATGNEAINVSAKYTLFLTAGRLRVNGKLLEQDRVDPDIVVPNSDPSKVAAMFDRQ